MVKDGTWIQVSSSRYRELVNDAEIIQKFLDEQIRKYEAGHPKQQEPVLDLKGSISEEIVKLHELMKAGILTEEEFSQLKKKLIDKI